MKNDLNRRDLLIIYSIGAVLTIWAALILSPYSHSLNELANNFHRLYRPFDINIRQLNAQAVGMWLIVYSFAFLFFLSARKKWRFGREHGDAEWGDVYEIASRYKDKKIENNQILTQKMQISYKKRYEHNRNMLTLVIGGSGAGKTRYYGMPNVLNDGNSYIVLDPKGEILRNTGWIKKQQDYDIKVLDLIHMEYSSRYNPLVYVRNEIDMFKLVTNLFDSTESNKKGTNDMWEELAKTELLAYLFYLFYEAPDYEKNFEMVLELFRNDDVKDGDAKYVPPTGILFNELEKREPDHIAVRYYRMYRKGSAKTISSVQVTLTPHLQKFELPALRNLTQYDDLNLAEVGEKKTMLYCIIPDNDTSFNFLISILYTQLFQQLFDLADNKYQGELPVHVHFLMDEFANVALPENFEKIQSVLRSRNMSLSIIVQAMSQLKALYKEQWEILVGNCDSLLYLGGNEKSTYEYISSILGKETFDQRSYGRNYGKNGNSSINESKGGGELLSPSQVRRLPNKDCILLVRGENPIYDQKYQLQGHPNYNMTPWKGGKKYDHKKMQHQEITIEITDDPTIIIVPMRDRVQYMEIRELYQVA